MFVTTYTRNGTEASTAPWLSLPATNVVNALDPLATLNFQAIASYEKGTVPGPGTYTTAFRIFAFLASTKLDPAAIDLSEAIDSATIGVSLVTLEGVASTTYTVVRPREVRRVAGPRAVIRFPVIMACCCAVPRARCTVIGHPATGQALASGAT